MTSPPQLSPPPPEPLYLVEAAFLSSTAVLVWLLSYSPLGPFVRLFFAIPVALGVMRWDLRTGMLTLVVSALLLTIILGPTRSIMYVMPYGAIGYWCGGLWRKGSSWYLSVLTGALISTFGLVFQFLLSSLLVGENLWAYLTIQLTGFTNWLLDLSLSWLGIYVVAQPWMIQFSVVGFIALNSIIYVFTVHLVAALVMERLKCPLPLPPKWVQFLLE
ncbi:MAG: DUF2232 domain-containing protein [Synechococcaceae cyanobacterium SM2_3_2]|nr:DUF2232 domain-containing protein [Synechococcaceae cyanobacterium SM2_3_2]